jgi:hypothetical protein
VLLTHNFVEGLRAILACENQVTCHVVIVSRPAGLRAR